MVGYCMAGGPWGAMVAGVALAALVSGCQSHAQESSGGTGSPTAGQIAACDPNASHETDMKVRKDRVAKGVFSVSRRVAVDGNFELWDTPYGRFWVVANNFETFADVLGEQAVEIYGDLARGVHASDVVLDCGAHFGGFTRTALNRGARMVVAIDIAPENIVCLRKNFPTEIAAGRVKIYEKGVWDKDDEMVLERKNHTWADQVGTAPGGPTVKVTTIDKIVSELQIPKVDFIKMDIEGAERNALTGAAATIKRDRPRMAIASYHLPDDLDVLPAVVRTAQPDYASCVSGRTLGHGFMTLFFR